VLVSCSIVTKANLLNQHIGVRGCLINQRTVAATELGHANRPIELTKLSFNISPEDSVKIIVTVSDGQSLHLSQQWPDSNSHP